MKKLVLLISMIITASTQACFLSEEHEEYQTSIATAYTEFGKMCHLTDCFPVVPLCERKYIVCFEKRLKQLEKQFDCSGSSALVERATNECLGDFI